MGSLSIARPGLFTTVQDLGRWGFQSRGVPVSGAMDVYSHRYANALVGNPADAATLEVTLTGPEIRFGHQTRFAVAGAAFRLTLDGRPVAMNRPVEAPGESVLLFGERQSGARAYLAVAGGIDVPPTLGSRSTHTVSRMGGHEGRALRAGDIVPVGRVVRQRDPARPVPPRVVPIPDGGATVRVTVVDSRLFELLAGRRYRLSSQSNRMGYLLEPPAGVPGSVGTLVSFGIPTGAIQVPPGGQPLLLMPDHATTGGYALVASVIAADLPIAGQLAPADWIELTPCSFAEARQSLRSQESTFG